MSQNNKNKPDDWMRLSEAAEYIGIHFTTLRRWSDDGDLPSFKTPGGRRRFKKSDLDAFLRQSQRGKHGVGEQPHLSISNSEVIQHVKHTGLQDEPWFNQISEDHRMTMRRYGRKLIGTLMQYTSQSNGDEKFVQEGKKFATQYGEICQQSGLSLAQTTQAFVMIRHSIIDGLCEGGMVIKGSGEETWRLFQRVNSFLDIILLAILDSFQTYSSKEAHRLFE